MTKDKKIIFVASYPKSGNTWVRIIISSLLNNNKGLFEIKDLEKIKLFSQYVYFSHFKNLNYQSNGNLDFKYVTNNWINAQKRINEKSKRIRFFKTHSVRGVINGKFFTNEEVCLGYIYIFRDPRDVAISFSKHLGVSIDQAIEIMLFNNQYTTSALKVNEPVCTWKNHFDSWLDFKNVSHMIIKYEDVLENYRKTISDIIKFLNHFSEINIKDDEKLLNNILKSTDFARLKKMEKQKGFKEASTHSKFFREGKSGQWKKILTNSQIKQIEKELYQPMKKLGYL